MMWHVVFAEQGGLPKSRAMKSREAAIQAACELLAKSSDFRRIIEPGGTFIDRAELDEHYDGGPSPFAQQLPIARGAQGQRAPSAFVRWSTAASRAGSPGDR